MGFLLRQALRTLCCNTLWNYAVFWKLTHRARMMLIWEDAYYGNNEHQEKKLFSNSAGNLLDGHCSHDALGLAVAKMSYHVYSLGEGIVGQVAVTGKHLWISADKWVTNPSSSFEYCDGWQTQFSAGVKTIVVVAVAPLGVVQLGSLDDIPEDLKMVKHIRDVFSEVHDSVAGHLQGAMQNNAETSCVSDVSTRTSGSEVYLDCTNNLDRSIEDGTNFCSSKFVFLGQGKHGHHSPMVSHPSTYPNKIHEVPNKHEGPGPPILNCERFFNGHQKSEVQTSNVRDSVEDKSKSYKNNSSGKIASCEAVQALDYSGMDIPYPPSEFLVSAAQNDQNGAFSLPVLPNAGLHKDSENNSFQSSDMNIIQTPLSFYAGYELYEALGPAFQKGNTHNLWETEKTETGMAVEIPEVMGDSSLLMSDSRTEHLLEAVIANVNCHESDANSVKSLCKSVESFVTTEKTEPCTSDVGTISSAGYSFDRDTLNSFNSSGACGVRSSIGLSSTSSSRGSGHMERPQEPARMNKRRAKPGESCRPRPRDRQLIQDRIKELRELVPNGSKCSIDSLLERTIKHMLFMQSITKHAEMLNKCTSSKWLDKEPGNQGPSSNEQGSSWAVEVGSNMKVCPIIVENLNMNGQMLVEMLLKDCSHFLEIAEAIRSLGLTILKGVAEACGEKTRMCFVVEGQNNQPMHRMDILWSLMQLLPPEINA
nr:transcription factor EMB1444-like isoform X2 [Ipomoea batatas]